MIIRIDVSKGGKHVVSFLNNLEKDAMYRGMPRSLKQLLYPSWSIVAVARNLFTLISVVDLFSEEGASLLMQMYMMVQQQYPVRMGLVLACDQARAPTSTSSSSSASTSDTSSSSDSIHCDFCRLFAALKHDYSEEDAHSFALSVASYLLEGVQMGQAFGMIVIMVMIILIMMMKMMMVMVMMMMMMVMMMTIIVRMIDDDNDDDDDQDEDDDHQTTIIHLHTGYYHHAPLCVLICRLSHEE